MLQIDEPIPTFGRTIRAEFLLDPGIAYLNHGERGAPRRQVLAATEQWRERIERQPVRFM
jgi:isopenicillin-N epimerase